MTFPNFHELPVWATALLLTAHFAAGLLLGLVYFRAVWWNARLFAQGGRIAAKALLAVGRFALLAGVLALTSREGAMPLLLTALGVVAIRPLVMRRIQEVSP